MSTSSLSKFNSALANFFEGKIYPLLVALIVTVGHITELEFYFNILHVLLITVAFCVCRSSRPLLILVPTFTFQVTLANSPAIPTFSDYYFTEWRLPVVIALGVIVLAAIAFFVIRNRLLKKLSIKNIPLLIPTLILSVAFLLNGAFSSGWSGEGLAFGAGQVLVYLVLFLLIYLGFNESDTKESLMDYLCYITLIIAFMIIAQMVHLFLGGGVFSDTGAIIKENVNLGWATCNPLGAILISLMPILFYGAMKKKHALLYFITAISVYVMALTTCSRNALLCGSATLLVCMIIACLASDKRRIAFRILFVVGAAALVAVFLLFNDNILAVFHSFVKQGTDNNGRFQLWGLAWKLFEENPLFGGGFFTLETGVYVAIDIMPTMAHNTILEILGSMGLVGFAAYLYYRYSMINVFIERPTLAKSMIAIACFVVIAESLLDVFVFAIYPMFYHIAALAVACKLSQRS